MMYADRDMHRANSLNWYRENRETINARRAQLRRNLRHWVGIWKASHSCTDCGEYFPAECMDFHHHDDNKADSVSHMINRGMTMVRREIAKCTLLCANCHRTRTKQEQGLVSV